MKILVALFGLFWVGVVSGEPFPVIYDANNVYVWGDLDYIKLPASALTEVDRRVVEKFNEFTSLAKKDKSDLSRFYYEKNGSRDFYQQTLKPNGYPFQRYDGASDIVPNVVVKWGGEIFVGFSYTIKTELTRWREDFICVSGSCGINSRKDYSATNNRMFEIAYKALIDAFSEKNKLKKLPEGKEWIGLQFLSSYPGAASPVQYKVGIKSLVTHDKAHEIISNAIGTYMGEVRGRKSKAKELQDFYKSDKTIYDNEYFVDIYDWHEGHVKIVSSDLDGHVSQLLKFGDYKLIGYLADPDYFYVLVDPSGDAKSGVAIFALKKQSGDKALLKLNKIETTAWQFLNQSDVLDNIYKWYADGLPSTQPSLGKPQNNLITPPGVDKTQ